MDILVLDGDDYANRLVHFILTKQGHKVVCVDNPVGAFQLIQGQEPHLIILEMNLRDMDGFQFVENLHAKGYHIPLLFTTSQETLKNLSENHPEAVFVQEPNQRIRISAKTKFKHLNSQTYDCIRKPYSHQELVACIQEQEMILLARREGETHSRRRQKVHVGNVEFVPQDLKVIIEGKSVTLTRTEAQVFSVLINNFNTIITRESILMEVWNDSSCNTNVVDVYIWRLRSKIEKGLGRQKYITSVRGVGYKFTGG